MFCGVPGIKTSEFFGGVDFQIFIINDKNQKFRTSLQILAQKGFGFFRFEIGKINDLDGGLTRLSITRVKSSPTKDSNDFEDTLLTRVFSKRI